MKIIEDDSGKHVVLGSETLPVYDVALYIGKDPKEETLLSYIDLEESRAAVQAIPLGFIRTERYCFGPGGVFDTLCESMDGEYPHKELIDNPVSARCGEWKTGPRGKYFQPHCPNAMWTDEGAPKCKEVRTLALFDLGLKIPIMLRLHGKELIACLKHLRDLKQQALPATSITLEKQDRVVNYEVIGHFTAYAFALLQDSDEQVSRYTPLANWYKDNLFAI